MEHQMSNAVLYAWGLFQPTYSGGLTNDQQIAQVAPSGFGTVILWSLHVDPQGNLTYNDAPNIVSNGQFNTAAYGYLPGLVQRLKDGGVKTILFGIGSGGPPQDFTHILNLMSTPAGQATLRQNFGALAAALPIDGFDLDIEDLSYDPSQVQPVADFTLLLHRLGNYAVTFCPYTGQQWWFDCLNAVYRSNGNQQVVPWFNLQCYAGGGSNVPPKWAAALTTYQQTKPCGVANPPAFIVPGYWARNGSGCAQGSSPAQVQTIFTGLRPTGTTGGFIWNSRDIFLCNPSGGCTSYAQAILKGLGGSVSDEAAPEAEGELAPA
jgi:hypothetical protein